MPAPYIVNQQSATSYNESPFYVGPSSSPVANGNLMLLWIGWSTYHNDNYLTPVDTYTTLVAENPTGSIANGLLVALIGDGTTTSYTWYQNDPDTVNWWAAEIAGWGGDLGALVAMFSDNFATTAFTTNSATAGSGDGWLALSFFVQDSFSNVIAQPSGWTEQDVQGGGYYFGIEVQSYDTALPGGTALTGGATYDSAATGVGAICLVPPGPNVASLDASLSIAAGYLTLLPVDASVPYNETQDYVVTYTDPYGNVSTPSGVFTTSAGTMDPPGETSGGIATLHPDAKIGDFIVGFVML